MENKCLEYRMYFFVIYQLSDIQKGIQCGHAALEYVNYYGDDSNFKSFIEFYKTWIILNGGTTNNEMFNKGDLNEIKEYLENNQIKIGFFHEPDLNNALTAVCFLADERVYDYKNYPDFVDYILDVKLFKTARNIIPYENELMLKLKTNEELEKMFPEYYKEWYELIGGDKNILLRKLIKDKHLA